MWGQASAAWYGCDDGGDRVGVWKHPHTLVFQDPYGAQEGHDFQEDSGSAAPQAATFL